MSAIVPELDGYLSSLRMSGRKESTIYTYRMNIIQCVRALESVGRWSSVAEITPDDIRILWRVLPVREAVRQTYLRNLAGLIIHVTGRDVVKQANLLHNRDIRTRTFISADEYGRMMVAADPFQRMILVLGGLMGLRRGEMAQIRDEDIRGGIMRIHGKGHGDDGLVVDVRIPPRVLLEIDRYRESKAAMPQSGDGYLLQTMGKRRTLCRATDAQISMAVSTLGKSVGVTATTHSLRRLYATTLFYDVGADIQTVRNLMRHADVSTTLKCYIEPNAEREREASDKLSEVLSAAFA